jgi:FkbM family methyltransferase
VTVFEPVPAFFEKIEELSESDNRIHLIRSAAGNAEGKIAINLDGDRSSHLKPVGATQVWVTETDLNSWIVEYGGTFNVTEINIEGAEYSLIAGLRVDTLRRLGTILLQTHDIGPETDYKLRALDEKLHETHVKAFSFRHVWSAWVPKIPI